MKKFGSILVVAAALTVSHAAAQTQPVENSAAAQIVQQSQIDGLIAACQPTVAPGSCTAELEALIASASAAGLSPAQVNEFIASVAGAMVRAAVAQPAIAQQVGAALQVAAARASGPLTQTIAAVATAVSAGQAASVDLTAVASVGGVTAPVAGQNGSPS